MNISSLLWLLFCLLFPPFSRPFPVANFGKLYRIILQIFSAVFSLLAVNFAQKDEGPDGTLELVLSGNASVALDVECVEVQLADTGGAWETSLKPRHPAV